MSVRIMALGGVAAGAIALGSAAFAQNVPAQFVVSGKAAEQIQDFTTINLATAERLAQACEKLAAARGVAISMRNEEGCDVDQIRIHRPPSRMVKVQVSSNE